MGFALGSEFLRNLGWNGFKPDRHNRRLLNSCVPALVRAQRDDAVALASLAGRKSKDVVTTAALSLRIICPSHVRRILRTATSRSPKRSPSYATADGP